MSLLSPHTIWQMAQSWVAGHIPVIWCIASPYYRYMSCDTGDFVGEAQIVVYQIISALIEQNKDLSLIDRYFRVAYRTKCIKMASNIHLVADMPIEVMAMEKEQAVDLDESIIAEALAPLTNRQRQVSHWILKQPRPVSLADIAKQFGIHQQNAGRLLSASIIRIKNQILLETA